jgi:hypothetical protein
MRDPGDPGSREIPLEPGPLASGFTLSPNQYGSLVAWNLGIAEICLSDFSGPGRVRQPIGTTRLEVNDPQRGPETNETMILL